METLQDIWTQLHGQVRGLIGKRVNDPHAAADIAQDVMLKVQTQLGALPPDDKLPAWVFRIARNAIIDHYRSDALRRHVDIDPHQPMADTDQHDQAEAVRALTPCLVRMVEHLPEPYRQAMKLGDLEGLSQQEIADRTGVSLSGAKSRVQRARAMLRKMIDDCCRVERDTRGNVMDFERTDRSARYCADPDGNPQCGR